jgi:hypothetical protein
MNPQIIMKESKETKVDPKVPSSHPGYKDALRAAEIAKKDLKFESEGERLDYEKAVRANPNNIPGLPPLYPPERIQPSHGVGDGIMTTYLPCGHAEKKIAVRKGELIKICRYDHEFIDEIQINQ